MVSSLSQISPDAAVREASVAAETKYDQFSIEQSMRHDIYSVITSYIAKTDLDSLEAEDARLLRKMERSFRRNGLHLSEEKRNEFKELRKKLSEVCIEFNKNWARESSSKFIWWELGPFHLTWINPSMPLAVKFTKVKASPHECDKG